MTRRQRQRDELLELCRSGPLVRAIDLAFEHFAAFGPDDEIVNLLTEAIHRVPASPATRRRLAELGAACP